MPNGNGHNGGPVVLIVDDDNQQSALLAKLVEKRFKLMKTSTVCASSMAEALDIAAVTHPTLAVVDLNLGLSSPPHTTIRDGKRLGCPIIAFTGVEDPSLIEDAIAEGWDDVIVKGSSVIAIIDKVGLKLEQARPREGAGRIVYEHRHSRWPRFRQWLAENVLQLLSITFGLAIGLGGVIGNGISNYTKNVLAEVDIKRQLSDHTSDIKKTKELSEKTARDVSALNTKLEQNKQEVYGVMQANQKEVLSSLAGIRYDIGVGKQERADIKETLRELRDDVRANHTSR